MTTTCSLSIVTRLICTTRRPRDPTSENQPFIGMGGGGPAIPDPGPGPGVTLGL